LKEVIQSIQGNAISTLIGRIPTKEVVIKLQDADNAKKEYDLQKVLKHFRGFITYECIFYCDGDKKYIESFSRLNEKSRLCKEKRYNINAVL